MTDKPYESDPAGAPIAAAAWIIALAVGVLFALPILACGSGLAVKIFNWITGG